VTFGGSRLLKRGLLHSMMQSKIYLLKILYVSMNIQKQKTHILFQNLTEKIVKMETKSKLIPLTQKGENLLTE
jgi:hypothetical protein